MHTDFFTLSPYDFDQTDLGWRALDAQGEYLEAARLVGAYIVQNKQHILKQNKVSLQTIHFHAGQEYAMSGETFYKDAVDHFCQAYKSKSNWDSYVKGTVAFLERDATELAIQAQHLNDSAAIDPQQKPNAKLLSNLLEGLSEGRYSYMEIYDQS